MSETTPEGTATAPAQAAAPSWDELFKGQDPAAVREALENSRKWEKRAKDNFAQLNDLKPKAEQFDRLEEASKSEAQRLAEAAETARRDAESARAEAIRYKAAATHHIGADHFDLLGTGTEEEISARAEKIASLVAAKAAADAVSAPPQSRPVESLRPGATPGEVQNEDDALYAQLFPNQ